MNVDDELEAMCQEAAVTYSKVTTSWHSPGVTHRSKKN